MSLLWRLFEGPSRDGSCWHEAADFRGAAIPSAIGGSSGSASRSSRSAEEGQPAAEMGINTKPSFFLRRFRARSPYRILILRFFCCGL